MVNKYPMGESAEDIKGSETPEEAQDVARRIVGQSYCMCLMLACAFDSLSEGSGMPEGFSCDEVAEAAGVVLMRVAKDLREASAALN